MSKITEDLQKLLREQLNDTLMSKFDDFEQIFINHVKIKYDPAHDLKDTDFALYPASDLSKNSFLNLISSTVDHVLQTLKNREDKGDNESRLKSTYKVQTNQKSGLTTSLFNKPNSGGSQQSSAINRELLSLKIQNFKKIKEITDVTFLQNQMLQLQTKLKKKEDTVNDLRRDFLKEVIHLRETYVQGKLGSGDKVKDYMKVKFFDFTDGLEEKVCEVLNVKLKSVVEQCNSHIKKFDDDRQFLEEVISKYKRLTPKTYKMVELSLDEIFEALSVIETDSTKIWQSMISHYPKGHFDGVIEDTFGTFLDHEAQEDLMKNIQKIKIESEKEVKRVAERLCTTIRDLEFQLRTKTNEITKLREDHLYELKAVKDDLKWQYEDKLREVVQCQNLKSESQTKQLQDTIDKNRQERADDKKKIDEMMIKLFWMKIQMISKVVLQFKKEDINTQRNEKVTLQEIEERNSLLFEKIHRIVFGSENSRLCALLQLKKEILKEFKEKYEKASKQLYDLKIQINTQIDDYEHLKRKYNEIHNSYNLINQFNNTMQNDIRKITHERDILIEAQAASMRMIANLELQKRQLELKYNINMQKQVQKGASAAFEVDKQAKTIKEKAFERLMTDFEITFGSTQLHINTEELKQVRKQVLSKVDCQVQTNLKNINFIIGYDVSQLNKLKHDTKESGMISESCQTKIKMDKFTSYMKKQMIEQEKLEKKLAKLKSRQFDEIIESTVYSKKPIAKRMSLTNMNTEKNSPVNNISITKKSSFGNKQLYQRQRLGEQKVNASSFNKNQSLTTNTNNRRNSFNVTSIIQLGFKTGKRNVPSKKMSSSMLLDKEDLKQISQESPVSKSSSSSSSDISNPSNIMISENEDEDKESFAKIDLKPQNPSVNMSDENILRSSKSHVKSKQSITPMSKSNKRVKKLKKNSKVLLKNIPQAPTHTVPESNDKHSLRRQPASKIQQKSREMKLQKPRVSVVQNKNSRTNSVTNSQPGIRQSIKEFQPVRQNVSAIRKLNLKEMGTNMNDRSLMKHYDGQSSESHLQEASVRIEDPRYGHLDYDYDDSMIILPNVDELKFDNKSFLKSIQYLKQKRTLQHKRSASQSQMERLYPSDQANVFKRLSEDVNQVKKFDQILQEIQASNNQSWLYQLFSQDHLSQEQLDNLSKEADNESERILKAMDQLIKIGKKPLNQSTLLDSNSIIKVKKLQASIRNDRIPHAEASLQWQQAPLSQLQLSPKKDNQTNKLASKVIQDSTNMYQERRFSNQFIDSNSVIGKSRQHNSKVSTSRRKMLLSSSINPGNHQLISSPESFGRDYNTTSVNTFRFQNLQKSPNYQGALSTASTQVQAQQQQQPQLPINLTNNVFNSNSTLQNMSEIRFKQHHPTSHFGHRQRRERNTNEKQKLMQGFVKSLSGTNCQTIMSEGPGAGSADATHDVDNFKDINKKTVHIVSSKDVSYNTAQSPSVQGTIFGRESLNLKKDSFQLPNSVLRLINDINYKSNIESKPMSPKPNPINIERRKRYTSLHQT